MITTISIGQEAKITPKSPRGSNSAHWTVKFRVRAAPFSRRQHIISNTVVAAQQQQQQQQQHQQHQQHQQQQQQQTRQPELSVSGSRRRRGGAVPGRVPTASSSSTRKAADFNGKAAVARSTSASTIDSKQQ
ncbi:MAG: hypothetical protein ABJ056_03850, partial [Halioglobus sp.]